MGGKFPSGEQHPKVVPWPVLEKKLDELQLNGLTILKQTYQRGGKYRLIDALCAYCKEKQTYNLDSLLSGLTTGCMCQRNRKYGGDPRAEVLGRRYDCIVQRCTRGSHKQSKDYKGRGIRCLFKSREHFIRWALETWPDSDFKGLEFDRKDNNGHYSPDNLRLVSSRENHLNRDGVVSLSFNGKLMHWSEWPSPYSRRRTQDMAAQGLSGEEIIKRAQQAVVEKRKGWLSIKCRLEELGYTTS
jgi:hypothetical protein